MSTNTSIKLVVHDDRHAGGLFLDGFAGAGHVVTELRGLEDGACASILLERFAERCLRAGRHFRPADPLVDTCPSGTDIVEVHLDPSLPSTPFVRLFEVDAFGRRWRRHRGTLGGVAGLLENGHARHGSA
ncbi:hypothetical protein [Azospirillum sp.]|uniref:hypothetical protein n=1 Tax=Azospirillum sp. TaxID=34012 RepID=UPI002D3BE864|nr:hypothetical protein [Azospirillum sp.]HYD71224.1 hypothetical protein [Azospirillum sp.]